MPRIKFDTVEDKAEWRRAQLARNAKLLREKRKSELGTLREENLRLKTERETFEKEIKRLQLELLKDHDVDPHQQALVVAENSLLKLEVEQHSLYLVSLLSSAELNVPDDTRVNREIARQVIENARTTALRTMTIADRKGEGHVRPFVFASPLNNARGVISAKFMSDDMVMLRADAFMCVSSSDLPFTSKKLRDAVCKPWENSDFFREVYMAVHPESSFSVSIAPDYSWDADPLDETQLAIKTAYVAESSEDGERNWVFVSSTSQHTMLRSSVWCGPDIAELLSAPATTFTAEGPGSVKKVHHLEEVPRGEALFYCGHRSVTCHFTTESARDVQVDDFVESYYSWEEPGDNGDRLFRMIGTVTGCKDRIRIPPFGQLFARLSSANGFEDEYVQGMAEQYMYAVLSNVMRASEQPE